MRAHGSVAAAVAGVILTAGEIVSRVFPHVERSRTARLGNCLASLGAIPAVLAGCADHPVPSEPTLEPHSAGAPETTTRVDAHSRPIAGVEAFELSAGLRTAMTHSIKSALAELDIQPNASLITLNDFFQEVEAQRAEQRQASADLLRTVHP